MPVLPVAAGWSRAGLWVMVAAWVAGRAARENVMGSFHVHDVVTGRELPEGEPVVAMVVARHHRTMLDEGPGGAGMLGRATDLFEAVSLPIRAAMDDYGRIVPVEGQESLRLLLAMHRCASWEEFEGLALERDCVGVPGTDDLNHPVPPQGLGLAVVAATAWDRLVAAGEGPDPEAEVEASLALLEAEATAATAVLGDGTLPEDGDARKVWFDARTGVARLATLRADLVHGRVDGSEVEVPDLLRCLRVSDGPTFGAAFRNWLAAGLGPRREGAGIRLPSRDLLDSLWQARRAVARMEELGVVMRPVLAGGQEGNDRAVADMAIGSLEDALGAMVRDCEECGDDADHDRVAAVVARLDAMRDAVVARLEASREALAGGPSGP